MAAPGTKMARYMTEYFSIIFFFLVLTLKTSIHTSSSHNYRERERERVREGVSKRNINKNAIKFKFNLEKKSQHTVWYGPNVHLALNDDFLTQCCVATHHHHQRLPPPPMNLFMKPHSPIENLFRVFPMQWLAISVT